MASTQSEVRALLDSWSHAIRMKDIDQLMSLYSPDVVYFDCVNRTDFGGDSIPWRKMESWHQTTLPARSRGGIHQS